MNELKKNIIRPECIRKVVAPADPISKNKFNAKVDKTNVGRYYLGNNRKKVEEFFNHGNTTIILDKDEIKDYYKSVLQQVIPFYKEFYLDKFATFINNYNEIKEEKTIRINGVEFGKNDNDDRAYMKFNTNDRAGLVVNKLLLGGITVMTFNKTQDLDQNGNTILNLTLDLVPFIQRGLWECVKGKEKLDGEKLKTTFENYQAIFKKKNQTEVIRRFCRDFGEFIIKDKVLDFEQSFNDDQLRSKIIDTSNMFDEMFDLLDNDQFRFKENSNEQTYLTLSNERASKGFNKIYYGIPGCGKSHTVDEYIKKYFNENIKYKDQIDQNVFRTTFYLDYTNTDFIGQLIPSMDQDGNVIYAPKFGPFTRALKRCYETDARVFLVIEELNRGNAAAIFGDLFQLLDRLDETKAKNRNDGSKPGDSEYPITNKFLEDYLHIPEGKVIIPSNLTILATMNTSDQNVFPLDTAFQRRWKKCKVKDKPDKSEFADYYVPNKKNEHIKWKNFLKNVNEFMLESDEGEVNEDKQIGAYFLTDNVLINPGSIPDKIKINDKKRCNEFNHKVIEYLWDDVAKFDRERWFNDPKDNNDRPLLSFDDLIDCINKYGMIKVISPIEKESENKKEDNSDETHSTDDMSEENVQNGNADDNQISSNQEDDMNGE